MASSTTDWIKPPTNSDGGPCLVDFIDILIYIVFYWADERLAGWQEVFLPSELWGPKLLLKGNSIDIEQDHFILVDPTTGRLRRAFRYIGTVDNPMNLHSFPFDVDVIDMTVWSG